MIGTSLPEYIFIRLCILALRAITPLSIFYGAYSVADPPSSTAGRLLLTWCILETVFWVLVYIPRKRRLQAAADHPPLLSREERKQLFWRTWDKIPNPEYYLRKWFLDANSQDIKRENIKDFLRWALLNKGAHEGEVAVEAVADLADEEEELNEYVDGIQTLLGRPVEPGRGKATSLRLTVDEVKMLHRPLLWYMVGVPLCELDRALSWLTLPLPQIVGLVDTFTAVRLYWKGFRLYRTSLASVFSIFPFRLVNLCSRHVSKGPDMSYWYRPHTSKTRLPVLFIHGIGIGLHPYVDFLAEINERTPPDPEDGEIGIIAIELMPISLRITSPILSKDELCRQINAILEYHKWEKIMLVSHSYGSVTTTHLLHSSSPAKPKIGPILLIDPVTFLLHLPDVCYNFTARRPRRANERQLHYFACTDMMVSHTLARHFFWADNILWKEDLKDHAATVSLAGRDLIVDTELVGRYIAGVNLQSEDSEWKSQTWQGMGIEVLWFPTCDHAQVFESNATRQKLVNAVNVYCKNGVVEEDQEMLLG